MILAVQNQWAALCVAHEFVGQKSESQILEPPAGIELASAVYETAALPLS